MAILENPRHEKFAQSVAAGSSQAEAYRAAYKSSHKWKDKTVWENASRLAAKDKVSARIKELQGLAASKAVMTAIERKEWLTSVIKSEEEEMKDKLKACDILNRMDGEYIDKVQVDGQINNPMAGLTTEELKKLAYDG